MSLRRLSSCCRPSPPQIMEDCARSRHSTSASALKLLLLFQRRQSQMLQAFRRIHPFLRLRELCHQPNAVTPLSTQSVASYLIRCWATKRLLCRQITSAPPSIPALAMIVSAERLHCLNNTKASEPEAGFRTSHSIVTSRTITRPIAKMRILLVLLSLTIGRYSEWKSGPFPHDLTALNRRSRLPLDESRGLRPSRQIGLVHQRPAMRRSLRYLLCRHSHSSNSTKIQQVPMRWTGNLPRSRQANERLRVCGTNSGPRQLRPHLVPPDPRTMIAGHALPHLFPAIRSSRTLRNLRAYPRSYARAIRKQQKKNASCSCSTGATTAMRASSKLA